MKKHTARYAIAIIVLCVLCTLLPGCSSQADEQVIRDTASAFLDSYKHPSRETAAKLVDDQTRRTYDQLELYGVDGYAIMQLYFAKFDYTIDEIAVNGDQATISVTMRNIDVSAIVDDTLSKYDTDKGRQTVEQLLAEGGDNAVYQQVYGELLQRLRDEQDLVSVPTAITLTRTNGAWMVDEKCIPNVMGAIYGGSSLDTLL